MTLKEIGDLIGLSPSAVSDIEQGRSSAPGGEAALKLDSLHRLKCSESSGRVRTKASIGR
jgi:transcriptional regulator with XRE-family HTH domain